MELPKALLDSLKGVQGFDPLAFQQVHDNGEQVTSIRINPWKIRGDWRRQLQESFAASRVPESIPMTQAIREEDSVIGEKVPWSEYGYYLLRRPSFTFDPLFHGGLYYVQEASSMFLEQAMKQLTDLSQPLKVLDLSAAPGGKTTHIQSLLSRESLLVSNEVIRSRCSILIDNVIKWGASNVIVTNNDPAAFGKLKGYFDILIVDAPCSGSGLFRKDPEAIQEWSPNNVALCSQRQQRILADALPALKEGGLLIYSTCSYSREEDEAIGEWLVEEWRMVQEKLKIEASWGITEIAADAKDVSGYRFYPYRLKGEGFFISCFRKKAEEEGRQWKVSRIETATSQEKEIIHPFLEEADMAIVRGKASFFAVPSHLVNEYALLADRLNIVYAGTALGEIMKSRLVPHHALAVSTLIAEGVPNTELSYGNAIRFLQRATMEGQPVTTGWQTVSYKNHRLGWINALPNRINNYYPKEMRILKQSI
jgi:16S rRNA C967 or C1407 C5-methylase (RsmB/RsmF family)/NOL1/NOP2/fmu family ribosome biogenesis protein